MKYPMYAWRDLKANSFGVPMLDVNDETAKRTFAMRLHDDRTMGFSPSDYDLYRIGEFETETAVIDACLPEFIVSGVDVF